MKSHRYRKEFVLFNTRYYLHLYNTVNSTGYFVAKSAENICSEATCTAVVNLIRRSINMYMYMVIFLGLAVVKHHIYRECQ